MKPASGRRNSYKKCSHANAKGVVAIEYALLFPVLLAFVLGLVDAGRVVWTQATLSHAVDVAARCGAIDAVKCGEEDAVKDYVVARAAGVALDAEAIEVEVVACGERVAVSHAVGLILPWTGKSAVMLKAEACYPL